jgi:hypothetical protein
VGEPTLACGSAATLAVLRISWGKRTLRAMKTASLLLLTAAAGLGALSVTRDGWALGPVDVEVAAKVGGGTNPEKNVAGFPPNALGLGLGARAGASLLGFYGGLSFMYYLGASQDGPAGMGISPNHESLKSVLYGVEVGYNISVPLLTLRPQLGIGNYTLSASDTVPAGGPTNTSKLYLEPGVTGVLSFGMWIVGADANVLLLPGLSGSQPAFTAHGQVGIKF